MVDGLKLFIDLFSGLGGAARAFDDHPGWCTLKIDNNEELIDHNRGLILADIADVDNTLSIIRAMVDGMEAAHGKFSTCVLWASPPCTEFSFASPARHQRTEFDLTLLDATIDIIKAVEPTYFIIENVKGAKGIFCEEIEFHLGPTYCDNYGAQYLWGNMPKIAIRDHAAFKAAKKTRAKGSRTLRPNYRALIPYELSLGLRDTIDHQRALTDMESL